MALPPVARKRRNHRLLHCAAEHKNTLLARLIAEHEGKRILVLSAGDPQDISAAASVTVVADAALDTVENGTFELLISFDLPETPQVYIDRLAKTSELALILFGLEDRPHLYGIETLLGRIIIQENLPEFAPVAPSKPKTEHPQERKRKPRPDAGKGRRDFKKEDRPPKKHDDGKPQGKRPAKGVSRYLGRDENGKPIFSGKTGERNHRYDGKPHEPKPDKAKAGKGKSEGQGKGKPPYNRDRKDKKVEERKGPDHRSTPDADPKRPKRRIKVTKKGDVKKSEDASS